MRRIVAGGVAALFLCSLALVAPAARAAPADQSISCHLNMQMKFQPAMAHGYNHLVFIKLTVRLRHCTGGTVTSANGHGGAYGDLNCANGVVGGTESAKAQVYWDTGGDSGLNFFFHFDRSRLRGKVTGGRYKGELVLSRHFVVTPLRGDCEETPLVRSKLAGTIGL